MARTIAKDHEEKRQAILGTAASFFAENGFDRSSMNQLAKACGVSKALIYHYYDSKDALLYDIVHTHLSDLLDEVHAVNQTSPDKEANLRQLIRCILLAYRDSDEQHQVQAVAMASLPVEQTLVLADLQKQMIKIVSDALSAVTPQVYAAHPEKLIPVTMSLFGMLNWFYMWHRPGKGISREEYADLVTDLVLRGVCGLQT
jgi:AcrR family transcriptional regulator